jgi:hypothetical protein
MTIRYPGFPNDPWGGGAVVGFSAMTAPLIRRLGWLACGAQGQLAFALSLKQTDPTTCLAGSGSVRYLSQPCKDNDRVIREGAPGVVVRAPSAKRTGSPVVAEGLRLTEKKIT